MKVSLMQPVCSNKMIKASSKALKSERFLRGQSVERFEMKFSEFIGTKQAVSVNNGTMALILSLLAMDVKAGDLVITTPASFIATANSILFTGATPLFADIKNDSYNIDPDRIETLLKEHKGKVKAIVPVHLYGYPAEMDRITEMASTYGVKVLEDACQAHGATYKGRMLGSIGDASAFSFYPSKNMTVCGDGGMITTNDQNISDILRSLRDNGRAKNNQYLHQYVGLTARMQSSNAAIGEVQLEELPKWVNKRRVVAKKYNRLLGGVGDLILPPKENPEVKPAYHLYVIRTGQRDKLKQYLESKEIECSIHYPIPIHLQPAYMKFGFVEGMFPNAEAQAKEVLSIPMNPLLKKEEIEYVAESIKSFFEVK